MRLLLILLLLSGCATATERADRAAWDEVCSNAPHRAGHKFDPREQRAMDALNAWSIPIEEVDEFCEGR